MTKHSIKLKDLYEKIYINNARASWICFNGTCIYMPYHKRIYHNVDAVSGLLNQKLSVVHPWNYKFNWHDDLMFPDEIYTTNSMISVYSSHETYGCKVEIDIDKYAYGIIDNNGCQYPSYDGSKRLLTDCITMAFGVGYSFMYNKDKATRNKLPVYITNNEDETNGKLSDYVNNIDKTWGLIKDIIIREPTEEERTNILNKTEYACYSKNNYTIDCIVRFEYNFTPLSNGQCESVIKNSFFTHFAIPLTFNTDYIKFNGKTLRELAEEGDDIPFLFSINIKLGNIRMIRSELASTSKEGDFVSKTTPLYVTDNLIIKNLSKSYSASNDGKYIALHTIHITLYDINGKLIYKSGYISANDALYAPQGEEEFDIELFPNANDYFDISTTGYPAYISIEFDNVDYAISSI